MQLACKDNLDDRAFDILVILDNPQLIQIALKYANKLNKQRLTLKITEYLAKLQGVENKSKTEVGFVAPAILFSFLFISLCSHFLVIKRCNQNSLLIF